MCGGLIWAPAHQEREMFPELRSPLRNKSSEWRKLPLWREKKTSVYPDDMIYACIWAAERDEDDEGVGYSSDVAGHQETAGTGNHITAKIWDCGAFSSPQAVVELRGGRRFLRREIATQLTAARPAAPSSIKAGEYFLVYNDWIKRHKTTSGVAAEIRARFYTTSHFRSGTTAKCPSTYWTKSRHPFSTCLYLYGTRFRHQTGSIYKPIFTGTQKNNQIDSWWSIRAERTCFIRQARRLSDGLRFDSMIEIMRLLLRRQIDSSVRYERIDRVLHLIANG